MTIDPRTEPHSDKPSKVPAKILIAEDDDAARRLLGLALEGMGYAVTTVSDGVEAAEAIEKDPPAIILLDLEMPRWNGTQVCAWLREHPRIELRDTPVIMLTAHDEDSDEVACLKAGANDFITKPITRASLAARVETQLRMRSLNESLRIQNEELARWRATHLADLEAAQRVQMTILPAHSSVPGWNFTVRFAPLIEVGGDIYGISPSARGGLLWIADATGHGVAAALYTTLLAILFDRASSEADPFRVLARVNSDLYKIFKGTCLLSAACLRLHEDGQMEFAGAGHPPLLIRRTDGRVDRVASQATLLGLKAQFSGKTDAVTLGVDDRALLCTDGLYGGRKADGSRLQMADVSAAFALEPDPSRWGDGMLAAGATDDDLTAILVQRDEAKQS